MEEARDCVRVRVRLCEYVKSLPGRSAQSVYVVLVVG